LPKIADLFNQGYKLPNLLQNYRKKIDSLGVFVFFNIFIPVKIKEERRYSM